MSKRTQKEIDKEMNALEDAKSYAPKMTMFGENNHDKIDRQIEFLRGDIDIDAPEFEEMDENEQASVLDAQAWLNGDSDDAPSAGWDLFKKKKK